MEGGTGDEATDVWVSSATLVTGGGQDQPLEHRHGRYSHVQLGRLRQPWTAKQLPGPRVSEDQLWASVSALGM